jgi:ubiquinone/menaquinone biosynthesis C-methylase UbiE
MRRLNFGCGYVIPDDWINVDIKDYGQEIIADAREGLPFADDSIDFIIANHTLQMFTYEELPVVLNELKRVMTPDGVLRILTPDLRKAIFALESLDDDYFPISDLLTDTTSGKFARYLFWHGDTRCAFDLTSMYELLHKHGFAQYRVGRYGDCELDSRENESLIVEAMK